MRSVPEWIATHDDQTVPDRVKLRIWRRQTDDNGVVHCGISGDPINRGDDVQLDHKQPLILAGQHRESNLHFVHTKYHRAKTAQEVAIRADTDARALSHVGIRNGGATGLEGRTQRQKRAAKDRRTADANKLAMPAPRSLFRDARPRALPAPATFTRGDGR